MSAAEKLQISPADFLKMEREAEFRHEYYQGEIRMMAGASINHNRISENLSGEIHAFLKKKKGCQSFSRDLRVFIPEEEFYTYPDLVVVCGEMQLLDREKDTLLNPVLIIEVLSPSTANHDKGEKFERYRSISSFREYILVDSRKVRVEVWRKNENELWTLMQETSKLDAIIEIKTIEMQLTMEEIYTQTSGLMHVA